jgi:hypothetical protein
MFEVDLTNQVPKYPSIFMNGGGAACCKMVMEGYPPNATKCYIDQTTIWNYIQANNKEPGVTSSYFGWAADPYAITKTLNDLCPPQYSWHDISGTDKNSVLYTLLRWIANYRYPSLICTFYHDYWSVLVYYRTSDDPRTVNNPTLERIGWLDPTDQGAVYEEYDGSVFMNSPYLWGAPCDGTNSIGQSLCGQIWNNMWIGIGEPPETSGSVRAESISRVGKMLISPKDAFSKAKKFLAESRRTRSEFLQGHLIGAQASRPMLVRELPEVQETQKTKQDVHYYIVPFTQSNDVDNTGAQLSRFSVLVNAYTGRIEQLCVFPKPVHYLSKTDATQILSRSLRLSRHEAQKAKTELVFQPGKLQLKSALPIWQVALDNKTIFVKQDGLIYGTLDYPSRLKGS